MKSVVYTEYGPPDVLHFEEVEKPTPQELKEINNLESTLPVEESGS